MRAAVADRAQLAAGLDHDDTELAAADAGDHAAGAAHLLERGDVVPALAHARTSPSRSP